MEQEVVYGTERQAFRSQRTHPHLLVAERAPEPQRNGSTLTAQSYQYQSRTTTESLVWATLLSTRSPADCSGASPTACEARPTQIESGPGVCAPEITNRVDPGINRGSLTTTEGDALGVPRIDLSIHLLSRSALDWLSSSTPFQAETAAALSEGLASGSRTEQA